MAGFSTRIFSSPTWALEVSSWHHGHRMTPCPMSGAVSQRVGRTFGAHQAARVSSDAGAESPPLGWVVVRISASRIDETLSIRPKEVSRHRPEAIDNLLQFFVFKSMMDIDETHDGSALVCHAMSVRRSD